MLIHQTLERLHELRLTGMAQAFEEQMRMPDLDGLAFEDRLALLLEREITFRDDRRLARLLQMAKLHLAAAAEDIDFRSPRGLDKGLVLRLSGGHWIRDNQNVLISGPTGTGKSYLACALGHSACRQGLSTRFYRFSRLLGELALARADGSYAKLLDRLARTQLLILDDFGLAPLTDSERRDVLELLEDRYGRKATLVTSQLPFEHWHDVVGDATFADAILDRLVHNAHRITLKGASMRPHQEPSVTNRFRRLIRPASLHSDRGGRDAPDSPAGLPPERVAAFPPDWVADLAGMRTQQRTRGFRINEGSASRAARKAPAFLMASM